jgi:acyl dehydratase
MGERTLRYDDLQVGDTAPAIDHELTRTDLVMHAGASGDFDPMHHDAVAARAAGLPSLFGHGVFGAGLVATAIADYVGIGNLSSYRMRFTRRTWPGEAKLRAEAVAKLPGEG